MKEQLKSAIAFAVSMPHAALWVVQLYRLEEIIESLEVSMPHAALWVVQQSRKKSTDSWKSCFNAARGFVGGAADNPVIFSATVSCFNAARGFVGGAAPVQGKEERKSSVVSMPHAALWVVQRL